MSASREKKARQERGADYVSPKEEKARKEQAEVRRTTVIFTVCAVVFVLAVAAMLVWNSGVIQRSASAATVNGQSYTAADVAYYYYNARSDVLNNNSASIDTSKSLREQQYTDGSKTWYDFVSENAVYYLGKTVMTAQAAKDAGFDGGETLEQSFQDTIASIESAASSNGYTFTQYIKAIYGSLMTRSVFERNLRMSLLADAYQAFIGDASNFSDAELTAAYEASPKDYEMASFESVLFLSSNYMPAETTTDSSDASSETDSDAAAAAALAATQEAAASALHRIEAGEAAETVADDLGATYSSTYAYNGSSDFATWLFDDARQDGDATVIDYYGSGSMVLVFHGRERADYHPVSVRHILVADEATANDLLAQFNAGDKSESSFAQLATANTTDTGSASNGGLYENIQIGQMVKPFEDWCFDANRKSGDTGIVQTDYGYHVMYFVGASDHAYWQQQAASNLSVDKMAKIVDNMDTQKLDGMKYIDA